ncbi:MAG: nucleotidyltransferase domain-containing protein [Nitrospirae bacterium]|nr:nucleotidyltransferase domain-containing protein [Nitrospirota bacterium]
MLENILNAAIGRILSVVTPKKVFLFGSAARGVMGVNSDIDLLVIVPSGVHRRKTAQNIYRNMIGVGFATDIVVVTEEDVERFINTDGMVIHPAVTGGRLIYGA